MKKLLPALLLLISSFALAQQETSSPKASSQDKQVKDTSRSLAKATFAGGCFWCLEPPFDDVEGVISTISGYSGGKAEDATYKKVSSGVTDHIEVMQVTYNPQKVSYERLLEVFWTNHDPFNGVGQFCDFGLQYRPAVFYHDDHQKQLFEQSVEMIKKRFEKKVPKDSQSQTVQTESLKFEAFYPAEDYHQDYYQKNKIRYKLYRYGCGRDKRLDEVWGKDRQIQLNFASKEATS